MDVKAKQVAFHDYEAGHYAQKWAIDFDDRCTSYVAGRMAKVVAPGMRFGRVLEVGCGTGFFLLNLARAGYVGEAHCTDLSPRMLTECEANGRRLGIDVHGRVADVEDLPYEDATFDLVVGHAVLHHVPDIDRALSEIKRVLKPGGRVLIAGEPTRAGDLIANQVKRSARIAVKLAAVALGRDKVLADRPIPHEHRHAAALEHEVDLHTFVPAELAARAEAAGLDEVQVLTEELTASWFGWATRTVEGMVGHDHLPDGYPHLAYQVWRGLYAFDEAVAQHLAPAGWRYNAILTGRAPS